MPPKLNKKEIMKIMNNEMKKKSPTKYTKTTPGGSYVVNRNKGETAKKPPPPNKNNNK
tara:strand:- start:229 stop:402 length:174 start_codon:yes stop_codon:yes gene_type:complete